MSLVKPVSLCMIVKNEGDFLDAALKSVKSVLALEDLVVIDTGSADRSADIAKNNGARVFDFEWCDDFSAARNYAAGKALNDWIFVLDADEELKDADIGKLELLLKDIHTVGAVTRVEMSDNEINMESRIYNRTFHTYKGRIHEQIVPIDGRQKRIAEAPVIMIHHGYLPEVDKAKGRHERNVRMLEKALEEQPDDPYLLFQLGKSFFIGNRDLPKACIYFEKVLSSNPDHRLEYVYKAVEGYGYALINTGQYEKALELRNKYVKYYGGKPQFRFLAAHICQNNGMLIEAVENYESCIGADIIDYRGITSYLSYYNIGVILECIGMVEDAISMYKNCGDYTPAVQRLAELA